MFALRKFGPARRHVTGLHVSNSKRHDHQLKHVHLVTIKLDVCGHEMSSGGIVECLQCHVCQTRQQGLC
jgi:hypothetical protein